MNRLSVGICGFGRIGLEHAGWLSRTRDLQAVAIADPTPARQRFARERGLAVFDTLDAMLEGAALDAVLIATPTAMHFEQSMRALAAGKHVLVEKPMALDLNQATQMHDLATSSGRVLSVFHNRRWDADYLAVRQALELQRLGKLINVESRLSQFASCVGPAAREFRPGWRNEASFGGGALFDWGSHFLDQVWRLLWPAKPLRAFAQLRGNVWSTDCDDFARVLLDFDNSAAALVEINTTTTQPQPRWRLDGVNGSALSPHSAAFDTATWAKLQLLSPSGPPLALPPAPPGLSESQIWDSFARAIRDGTPPAVPSRTVLPTMQLLDAARRSSAEGRAVEIEVKDWKYE